jgi:adenine-specific DNA-methyltransferase
MNHRRDLKLELTWVGKDHRPRLEPRILLEDPEKNYHAAKRLTEQDQFENMLIFGDNLLALKALSTDDRHQGKVKCIFIDPPYNTGSAFEHYDDGMEHSLWLSMMRERLELLRELLSEDGSIWISIDDNEAHYLKVLCDEIFGRRNFVSNVIWQKKYSKQNDAKWLSTSHDHILIYAKSKENWKPNHLERDAEGLKGYSNPDRDPRGVWQSVVYTCAKTRKERPNLYYPVKHPKTGELIFPSETRVWAYDQKRHEQNEKEGRVWWGINLEKDKPRLKSFLDEVGSGVVPDTLWLRDDSGDNQESKREARFFNSEDTFETPKPERLLYKIIQIATKSGEMVLDSFAGSGTTGAVAQKMGRRWIMVELGEHAHTHIIPRLQKVIDGTDQGGISQSVGWRGGGGFRYFKLAPSLIKIDRRGNEVINPEYSAEMLAEACCKLKGFRYEPSQTVWWQHGQSSERDFIFVTTRYMDYAALQDLSEDVGPERSLLVLVKAYDSQGEVFDNLTVEKIPESVLHLAEWDHDDYSLKVENLPKAEEPAEPVLAGSRSGRNKAKDGKGTPNLFDLADGGA